MSMMRSLLAAAPSVMVLATGAGAAESAVKMFALPAGPLPVSLRLLAQQSGERILYDAGLVNGISAPAVEGQMSVEAALSRLLDGSGLVAERTARDVLILRRPATVLSQLDDVIVTGTLLRGAGDGPSPVVVVTREAIDQRGFASVAEALAALPQNFAGTANEATLPSGTDLSGVNASYASGLNLRGLGSDATLVLVNGRRLAGSGAKADFADISTIPTAAVERVEVLLDGASAIYGSDAVGGVVNIILKTDFEGAETRLRVGGVADGPAGEYGFGQTLGGRWSSGSGLISYEYLDREALPASERPRAGNADLRPFGGTDRRTYYSSPGTIVGYDPALGAYAPLFAIPQTEGPLAPGDFRPGEANLENHLAGTNVLGRQTRHSLFAAMNQTFGGVTVSGDLRYGRRDFDTRSGAATAILTVDSRNPYFVSPIGAAQHEIAYSFRNDIGNTRSSGRVEAIGASLGAEMEIGQGWRASGYLAYARDASENHTSNQINSLFLSEALGRSADDPQTAYSAARDGYFNPFGSGDNPQSVTGIIGSGRTRVDLEAEVATANLQLDGDLILLPAGPLRLATGVAARRETQGQGGEIFTYSSSPLPRASRSSERDVAAAFLEMRAPVFGAAFRRPGFERLEVSFAVRLEDYDDIGSTTNPKIGLLWSPAPDLLARVSYGTSFRAPALVELTEGAINAPTVLPDGAGQTVTMIQYGGNPDLRPEEAVSWTAGLEYRPARLPGLRLAADWFQVSYDGRIGRPALDNVFNALNDPTLSAFVQRVAPGQNGDDRALIEGLVNDPITLDGGLFPVEAYGAVLDARYVNTSALEVEGVDLNGSYRLTRGDDTFSVTAAGSWLLRYDTRATPTSAFAERLNTPNNPIDFRGRLALDWTRGAWSAGAAMNYVDGYRSLEGDAIDSFRTADLRIGYEPERGPLAGAAVSLSVRNLLNEDPPFYDAPQGIAYDAANADVLGRFVALQVTRRW